MMQKIKQNIGAVLLGASIVVLLFLSWVFWKNLSLVQTNKTQISVLMDWACSKDPMTLRCVGADGKPIQVNQPQAQAPAPAAPATK